MHPSVDTTGKYIAEKIISFMRSEGMMSDEIEVEMLHIQRMRDGSWLVRIKDASSEESK